jgi:uncharacterized protein YcnI
MRVLLVAVAALVVVPAAFAHAEISPTTAKAKRSTLLHLSVPCESETASTVAVRVTPPPGVELSGSTSWTGRSRGGVKLAFSARAEKPGDYPLRVRQTYSDGRVVDWSGPESSNTPAPVLHVEGTQDNGRDRVIITIAIVAIAGGWLALRRGRKRA